MFLEDDLIPISALSHYNFCPHRVMLLYVDQIWCENQWTMEGRILHETTDQENRKVSHDIRFVRSLRLVNWEYGLCGIADVIEFIRITDSSESGGVTFPNVDGYWYPIPVEFKRGKKRTDRSYEIQLCAQALCLEETFHLSLNHGFLYFGGSGQRKKIELTSVLRKETIEISEAVRRIIFSKDVPRPVYYAKKCRECSLVEYCLPKIVQLGTVKAYFVKNISDKEEYERTDR